MIIAVFGMVVYRYRVRTHQAYLQRTIIPGILRIYQVLIQSPTRTLCTVPRQIHTFVIVPYGTTSIFGKPLLGDVGGWGRGKGTLAEWLTHSQPSVVQGEGLR